MQSPQRVGEPRGARRRAQKVARSLERLRHHWRAKTTRRSQIVQPAECIIDGRLQPSASREWLRSARLHSGRASWRGRLQALRAPPIWPACAGACPRPLSSARILVRPCALSMSGRPANFCIGDQRPVATIIIVSLRAEAGPGRAGGRGRRDLAQCSSCISARGICPPAPAEAVAEAAASSQQPAGRLLTSITPIDSSIKQASKREPRAEAQI